MSDYPKTMTHPNERKARSDVQRDARGRVLSASQLDPGVFHPVIVESKEQEEMYRAQGYRAQGEAMTEAQFEKYPMYMHRAGKDEQGKVTREELLVLGPADETKAQKDGWISPNCDVAAFEKAHTDAPPDDYKPDEYPKWLGQDENKRDIIVNSRAEELALRPKESPIKASELSPETATILKAKRSMERSEKMKAAWAKRKAKQAEAAA